MPRSNECPKCSGHMDEGFLIDQNQGKNVQAKWVDGSPTPSFWTGIKLAGRELHPVTTFRCGRCGYLESYAAPS